MSAHLQTRITSPALAPRELPVDIGDALVSVETWGQGSPVVLVSGIDGRAALWRHQATALAAEHRVVAFDQRGTGRSTHSNIRYSVHQMAEDLVSLLEALQLETAAFVGHGLGSAALLELASKHRERVERLVLLAPWAAPSRFLSSLLCAREEVLRRCGTQAYATAEALGGLPAAWLSVRQWQLDALTSERAASLAETEIESSRLRAAGSFNMRARLPSIRVPTLVISAADDQVVPCTLAREVALSLPDARLEVIETGGHYCLLVDPERINASLLEFLRR